MSILNTFNATVGGKEFNSRYPTYDCNFDLLIGSFLASLSKRVLKDFR